MSENPLHILKNEWLEPVYARESFFKKLAKKLKSKEFKRSQQRLLLFIPIKT